MKIFSESGVKLLPMVGSMRELREEAEQLGLTMTKDDTDAAAALTDAIGRLKSQFTVATARIGAAFTPALLELGARFSEASAKLIGWIKRNQDAILTAGKITVAVIAAGAAFVVLGKVIAAAGLVFKAFSVTLAVCGGIMHGVQVAAHLMWLAITSPVVMIVAAVAAVAAAMLALAGVFDGALAGISSAVSNCSAMFKESFGAISKCIAAGEYKLALEILGATLKAGLIQ